MVLMVGNRAFLRGFLACHTARPSSLQNPPANSSFALAYLFGFGRHSKEDLGHTVGNDVFARGPKMRAKTIDKI